LIIDTESLAGSDECLWYLLSTRKCDYILDRAAMESPAIRRLHSRVVWITHGEVMTSKLHDVLPRSRCEFLDMQLLLAAIGVPLGAKELAQSIDPLCHVIKYNQCIHFLSGSLSDDDIEYCESEFRILKIIYLSLRGGLAGLSLELPMVDPIIDQTDWSPQSSSSYQKVMHILSQDQNPVSKMCQIIQISSLNIEYEYSRSVNSFMVEAKLLDGVQVLVVLCGQGLKKKSAKAMAANLACNWLMDHNIQPPQPVTTTPGTITVDASSISESSQMHDRDAVFANLESRTLNAIMGGDRYFAEVDGLQTQLMAFNDSFSDDLVALGLSEVEGLIGGPYRLIVTGLCMKSESKAAVIRKFRRKMSLIIGVKEDSGCFWFGV